MRAVRMAAGVLATLGVAVSIGGGSRLALGASPASDNAAQAVYLNFPNPDGLSGLNGGTGFSPWLTSKRISSGYNEPAWPGFAGWFQAFGNIGAAGNPDLNDIGTLVPGQPGRPAFGSYANSSQPDRGVAITAATREFTGGELGVGQTFSVLMEHGNVSFYPSIFDLRTFGWVGVVLHTNSSWAPDPFQNGIGFFATVGFGFRGGQTNYELVSAAGTEDTGIPFTQRGLRLEFTRSAASELTIRVTRLNDNQQWTLVRPLTFGQLNGFGLVNRYAREANVYFNAPTVSATVVAMGACCRGATCEAVPQDQCAGPGERFGGAASVCNAPGAGTTPCCRADFDQNGNRDVADIFAFLSAWFAADPRSDVDGGGRDVADIFSFLSLWF
ncbi:MAG: hypothetical protein K2Q20_14660, partial [Phycisphaerales bacterium]|nr:hypothetical protein [Phycisphaerales bacterium]